MATTQMFRNGYASAILVGTDAHILKMSSSRYHLALPNGNKGQYCCQDGCCDMGLAPDVLAVVEMAKAKGATRVIVRTGQRGYYLSEIGGLPTSDVTSHIGDLGEGARIYRAW